ncbi:MAG: hypothetical protein FJ087_13340, partial [Deltaproteobacteria bacterium]|nr:hypothetical protein [Deltaproteobacteria bacterium]
MRAVAVLFIVALAACGSERSPAPADVPADAPLPPDAADVADAPPDAPAADADAAVPDLDVAADAAAEADVAEVGPDVLADVPTDVAPEEVDPCPGACGPLGPGCVDETHRGECVDADGEGPGCPEWTEAQSCMPGEECSKGECLVARCLPDCPEMKLVPAGPFWMGCNNGTGVCPGNAFDEMCPPEGVFCYLIQVPSFYMDRF